MTNLPAMPTVEEQVETAKVYMKARSKREREFFERPELLEIITTHVSEGGALTTLCKRWGIRYGRVAQWLAKDKERYAEYERAQLCRKEFFVEQILDELHAQTQFDVSQVLDSSGRFLPIDKWPPGAGRMIESINIKELASRDGEQLFGEMKSVKFHSKQKALELLGRAQSLYIENVQHKFTPITLSDLVESSWDADTKDVTDTAK